MQPTHVLEAGLHAGFDVGQLPFSWHSTQVAALSLHTGLGSLQVGLHAETKPPVPAPPIPLPPVSTPPVAAPPVPAPPVASPPMPIPPVASPPVAAPPLPAPPASVPPMPMPPVPMPLPVPLAPPARLALEVAPPVLAAPPMLEAPPTPLAPPVLVAVPPCPVLVEAAEDEPAFGLLQVNVFAQSLAFSEQPRKLNASMQRSAVLVGAFIGGGGFTGNERGSFAVAV